MRLFSKTQTVADNEEFITLIRVAREDREVRTQLAAILAQPSFHRQSLLNAMISEMKLKAAPLEFINAIACLLDDAIAAKARELIGK